MPSMWLVALDLSLVGLRQRRPGEADKKGDADLALASSSSPAGGAATEQAVAVGNGGEGGSSELIGSE